MTTLLTRTLPALLCVLLASGIGDSVSAATSWLDPRWSHRVRLTVEPGMIAGGSTFTNITLLLHLQCENPPSVFSVAKSDGSDLIVTSGDGTTVLDHEVVSFDPSGPSAEVWVRAPILSASSNLFYVYAGNPDTVVSTPSPWGDDHLAVYHFNEDPAQGILEDSGPSDNSAQTGSGWADSGTVPGKIGSAWSFNGTTDHVFAETISSPDSSFTISAWFTNANLQDEGMVAFQSLSGFWDLSFRRTEGNPNASLSTTTGSMSWEPDLLDALPHHYLWTLDAVDDTARFYLDGVEQAVRPFPRSNHAYMGELIQGRVGIAGPVFFNPLDLTCGIVDEYHIVEGVRDPLRVLTEYRNQNSPATFFSCWGLEALVAVGVDPSSTSPAPSRVSVWPNPFQGRAEIQVDGQAHGVRVYDVAGRLVRTLHSRPGPTGIRLHWDGRDDQGKQVGSGIYYVHAIGDGRVAGTKIMLLR